MALSKKIRFIYRRTTFRYVVIFLTGVLCAIFGANLISNYIRCTPKYAIYAPGFKEIHLRHVMKTLELLGYERTNINDDWQFLWTHYDPFYEIPERMQLLKPHQIVNKIAGGELLTMKVLLSTSALPFMPMAFRLPEDSNSFLSYAQKYPNARFLVKDNGHRNIRLRAPRDINLSGNNNFIQEYVEYPLLVDGHKFDIGVFVVVTSVEPLLAYIYTGDVIFRYCPLKYLPFDANIEHKYVIDGDYLPTWNIPALRKYYNCFGGNMRDTFEAYVRKHSMRDPSIIWTQAEEIIRQTLLAKQKGINNYMKLFKNGQFFELMRFDMMIDYKFTVYLMEVNSAPNLSTTQFPPLAAFFEQVLYSLFNLVNIGSSLKYTATKHCGVDLTKDVITSKRHLVTNITKCEKMKCEDSCAHVDCTLCLPCLNDDDYEILEKVHREHLHRIYMKRVFPKPIIDPEKFNIEQEVQNKTEKTAWLMRWFYNKCKNDRNWCT